MKYEKVVEGSFIERPNRFIAYVDIQGRREKVHVKNTGRCRELLVPGAKVYLEQSDRESRKTGYDLIAVEKGALLVNIDSQAPNKAVGEWLKKLELFPDLVNMRPETTYGNSRFDFYIETSKEKIFMEVKGVTLEKDGVLCFPDAPSERAVKHVEELIRAHGDGYQVYILFVIQMEEALYFMPNWETHPEFAKALCRARENGVKLLAYNCHVRPDFMELGKPVPVYLQESEIEAADTFGKNLSELKTTLRIGELKEIPNPLLKWYDRNRRILPWRESPSPYRVWVSEIMLQQTRVEAVKPYFERFMESLPDIKSLSEAPEEVLLKLWEGLGYYNRVRNLKDAAIQIMEEYDGKMPAEFEKLLKLKGIGSYTAGAIASIAFGKPVAAVDGNVLRVLSRIRMDERIIDDNKVKASVEEELNQMIPWDRPGDFNQAMMEIGACVCLPNGAPHCDRCPLEALCLAHREGCESEYPKRAPKKARAIEEKTILVIHDENRAALCKRSNKGLLAGLYEFPTLDGFWDADDVVAYLARNGIRTLRIQPLEDAKHIFTHKEWHMRGFMVRVDELSPRQPTENTKNWLFIEPWETKEKYPMPSAFAAYMKYL